MFTSCSRFRRDDNLVEIIRDLKANSSRFMKTQVPGFSWQDGYSAISVSPSQINTVKRYIANQTEHHRQSHV